MTKNPHRAPVKMAFEGAIIRIAIADILPLRAIKPKLKSTKKYTQIVASIREVGIIEPPVVAQQPDAAGKYLLLVVFYGSKPLKTSAKPRCNVSCQQMTRPLPIIGTLAAFRSFRSTG